MFAFDPASNRVPVRISDDNTSKAQTDTLKNEHGRPRELIQNGKRIRYTYDSHGRVLYKTTEALSNPETAPRTALQLQYNANNELEKSLRTQYQGKQVIKTLTEYHYDAFGRRIYKHSETRNFTQNKDNLRQISKTQHRHIHMLWDSDLPIQEYSDTHVYTTVYDQGSFKPVARLAWLRDDLPEVANDNIDSIDREQDSSVIQVYHYHNDQLGTPNELTNNQGEVVWLADYQAWGETREEMCWGHILVSQGESCARVVEDDVWHEQQLNPLQVEKEHLQPIRFQGQHFDTETGLHYNRFRYYDADMGMFTTRDPIGLMGGSNVFQYAPNPTGWIDPLGLDGWGALEQYGQSPGMQAQIGKAMQPPQTVSTSKGFKIPLPKSKVKALCENGIVAVSFNAGVGAGVSGRLILTAKGVSGYVGGGVGVGFGVSGTAGGKVSNIKGSGIVTSVTANGGAGFGGSANLTSGTPGASGSAGVGAGIGLGVTSTIGYLGDIYDFNINCDEVCKSCI
uniref:RHS repeat domain-containing protein n=1 Tax=uncultured Psychrobacter sp. TaxID=259303 RepID=UPI002594B139|nr:RHS repeat-associated core domain-containing protein [uncultured Psychrobacter sp.]